MIGDKKRRVTTTTIIKPGAREIQEFLHAAFAPGDPISWISLESVDERRARLRMHTDPAALRPGRTISGPIQVMLADTAAWSLVLHNLGFAYAASVTSNLNINFLARPDPADLLAEASLLRLGKRLAVAEVRLLSEARPDPVAHATITYALVAIPT